MSDKLHNSNALTPGKQLELLNVPYCSRYGCDDGQGNLYLNSLKCMSFILFTRPFNMFIYFIGRVLHLLLQFEFRLVLRFALAYSVMNVHNLASQL